MLFYCDRLRRLIKLILGLLIKDNETHTHWRPWSQYNVAIVLKPGENKSQTIVGLYASLLLIIVDDALRGVYSDTTRLNSTDPVEQRTAKSVVFLFMTSRPTN